MQVTLEAVDCSRLGGFFVKVIFQKVYGQGRSTGGLFGVKNVLYSCGCQDAQNNEHQQPLGIYSRNFPLLLSTCFHFSHCVKFDYLQQWRLPNDFA